MEVDGLTGRSDSPFVNEGRVAMSFEKLVEYLSALDDPGVTARTSTA
jgi:hypothetical protein